MASNTYATLATDEISDHLHTVDNHSEMLKGRQSKRPHDAKTQCLTSRAVEACCAQPVDFLP